MRSRTHPELRILVALAVAAAIAFALTAGEPGLRDTRSAPTTWRSLVGDAHPVVSTEQRRIVLLRTPSVADRLRRVHYATEDDERRWAAQARAVQAQVLTALAAHGLGARPEYSFTRVVNGFSAVLDARSIAVLEALPEVAGIFPVRAAFPAALSAGPAARAGAPGLGSVPGLPGYPGRGLTIALLDTGVDRSQPSLRGRVEAGYDVVDAGETADAKANPQAPAELERHGTQLAGLLVGGGGGALGARGVAPAATVLPIRVAGWQPDAEGRTVVYARSDQLIAGLERAVDPDGDGDAHDAARVALVGVAAPFAAFADSPEARAISGALALDTLVVTPAGNDGVAGPLYGSLAGPGGARDAIAVGAEDPRARTASIHLVLRRGLDVLLDDDVPLLGAVAPAGRGELAVGVPRTDSTGALDFYDRRGLSLVAGRAAFVDAGGDAAAAAIAAGRAGAAAVVVYGEGVPAGTLGLSSELGIPVVAVPSRPARAALAARQQGYEVGVALGRVLDSTNARADRVAPFSSRGLSFGGFVKPDLTAPGVALPTADTGTSRGAASLATVNGTSAAAAVVAGSAAVLAQARPGLDARELASLLVGYARSAPGADLAATGAGRLDLGASAAAEVVASERSVAFGPWQGPRWRSTRTVTIRNVSTRRLLVDVTAAYGTGAESLRVDVKPRQLVLRVGKQARIEVTARASTAPPEHVATGVLAIRPSGSQVLRLPWAVAFPPEGQSLVPAARLDRTTFRPSDVEPALLHVRVGKVVSGAELQIVPASRLDVLLYDATGKFIGVLARLRDLLPGTYTFGITGRSSTGLRLEPGRYELRLAAWPVLGDEPTRARVPFEIG